MRTQGACERDQVQISLRSKFAGGPLLDNLRAMSRSPYSGDPKPNNASRNIPILPSSTQTTDHGHGEPMDVSSTPAVMGPPVHSSPETDQIMGMQNGMYGETTHAPNGSTGNGVSAAAITASQQPKVVQTAFIHKLYKCDRLFIGVVDRVKLTITQHARRSQYTTSHLVVQ